ncbi:translocation/assembly module TamB [Buchnera aphidicola (Hyadaphis tataricae)]|uniref:Translocation/assembly module TamB n=1 Tax=Buchnera aphidicola (Hyadaphis tataricae) TaxID=1241859 RepID=A0A4D6Y4X3_9GAMM|nr:translocation/assembly module TamB [Buchnera aphidicola]QCI21408.1 translocation/assembly module TamB [Buchnera aphidicola (Hyadaphis tataricae)]
MSIYHRSLSRFLIFLSVLFVAFLLFIESNIGFRCILNVASRFFLDFQTEEVSGNWHDFTLKNFNCKIFGASIRANSIHVLLDMQSMFKSSTMFDCIEAKDLKISINKNQFNDFNQKQIKHIFFEKNQHIEYPIFFKKIHVDKILFKIPETEIFLSNVLTKIEFLNNHITIFPTYIDIIEVISKNVYLNKVVREKSFFNINTFHQNEKKQNLFFLEKKIFFPLNINVMFLKCKKIHFKNYKKIDFFELILRAQIKQNILKIKDIKICSKLFKMESYGKIFFNKDSQISCVMHNNLLIPSLNYRINDILFIGCLNETFQFHIISKTLRFIRCSGVLFFNSFKYPFFVQIKSINLPIFIKNSYDIQLKNFNAVVKGTLNNYSIFIKSVFNFQNLSSFVFNMHAQGSFSKMLFNKVKIISVKKKIFITERNSFKKHLINRNIFDLIGTINILGQSNNHTYDLSVPKIYLHGYIMQKAISVLGSIDYNNADVIAIPKIHVFLGQNKFFLKGIVGKKYDVDAIFYASYLDYFLPHLKGNITSHVKIHGYNFSNTKINSKTFGHNINFHDFYLKSFHMIANIDIQRKFLGSIFFHAKKIDFKKFYINSLYIQSIWKQNKQKLLFLIKNKTWYANFVLYGALNDQKHSWNGSFKKMNISTILGIFSVKNNSHSDVYQKNIKKDNQNKSHIIINNIFSSFIYNTNKMLFNMLNRSFIDFKSQVSIHTRLYWDDVISSFNGTMFLKTDTIEFKREIKNKIFSEYLDGLELSIQLNKNNLQTQWILKKTTNLLESNKISGYLNIIDIYDKKNLNGKFFVDAFPISTINFFTRHFKKVMGTLNGDIIISGNWNQKKVLSNMSLKQVVIHSNNLLKYIKLFFPSFSNKLFKLKINQSIFMKHGKIVFTLHNVLKNVDKAEWTLLFKSNKIAIEMIPKIKFCFSTCLNLHYLLEKYDIFGYMKFPLFYFAINEKNFVI